MFDHDFVFQLLGFIWGQKMYFGWGERGKCSFNIWFAQQILMLFRLLGRIFFAVAVLWCRFVACVCLKALQQALCVSAVFEIAGHLVCVLSLITGQFHPRLRRRCLWPSEAGGHPLSAMASG